MTCDDCPELRRILAELRNEIDKAYALTRQKDDEIQRLQEQIRHQARWLDSITRKAGA